MELDDFFLRQYELSENTLSSLLSSGNVVTYAANTCIIREGKLENSSYLIISGCVKAHLNNDGKDVTFWFGFEGDFLFSYNSKILKEPGYESITTLEKCQLWKIDNEHLDKLCIENIEIINWWRSLIEKELIKTERRLIDRQTKAATQRYQELITAHPQVLQRISLGTIASYLGISQVSLSRIRRS
ncbi:Crp/Fnr family transcriptional regulator [Echinicola strongylocentroti]|uniref:Crp/Fnr family transcriptional regulator n=1 Tax=Echinicola strongylocentroti TaxID=1795355 RepID=A0A2Z4IPZ4_9BACT|nr:Crp/Fnr family transcriptional regulator [Echinicola strongylocentroti]AWW32616.1 Crp/Fnr family transcriptional regulator [Echinicola strongylocentroti]